MTAAKLVRVVQPWERAADENGTSWDGFMRYRDMGPSRSIAAVASATGIPLSTLKSNASSWHWVSRAENYDRFLDSQRTQSAADEEKTRARRQRQILNELGEATLNEVQKLLAESRNAGFSAMKAKDVLHAAELVIKLSRLVDGESTDNIALATKVDYSRLSDAELNALEAISKKVVDG